MKYVLHDGFVLRRVFILLIAFCFFLFFCALTHTTVHAQESVRAQLESLYPDLSEVELDTLHTVVLFDDVDLTDETARSMAVEQMRLIVAEPVEFNDSRATIESIEVIDVTSLDVSVRIFFRGGSHSVTNLGYQVEFLSSSDDESQTLARRHVHAVSDNLSLAAEQLLVREVTIPLRPALADTYNLNVVLGDTTSGEVVSTRLSPEFEVVSSGGGVQIHEESCYLSVQEESGFATYRLLEGVDIEVGETLELTCSVTNTTAQEQELMSRYVTYYRSLRGEIQNELVGSTVVATLKPLSTEEVTFTIPNEAAGQSYRVLVDLITDDGLESTAITAHYVVRGNSATIRRLDVDSTEVIAGETVQLTLTYSGRADAFPGTRADTQQLPMQSLFGTVTMRSADGAVCGESQREPLPVDGTLNTYQFFYEATVSCSPFSVDVSIDDGEETQLAATVFDFEPSVSDGTEVEQPEAQPVNTISESTNRSLAISLIIVLVLGGWVVYRLWYRPKKLFGFILLCGVGLSGSMMTGASEVEAKRWTETNFHLAYDILDVDGVTWVDHSVWGNFANYHNGHRITQGDPIDVHGATHHMACDNAFYEASWFAMIQDSNGSVMATERRSRSNWVQFRFSSASLPPGRYTATITWGDRRTDMSRIRGDFPFVRHSFTFYVDSDAPTPPPPTSGDWDTGPWSSCDANPSWGPWSGWGSWSSCSASCDGGTQGRSQSRSCQGASGNQTRSVTCNYDSCTGPRPATSRSCAGSGSCPGLNSQSQSRACNQQPCNPTVSVWADLSGGGGTTVNNTANITPANDVSIGWSVTDSALADTTTCEATNALGSHTLSSSGGSQAIDIDSFTLGQSTTFGVRCRSENSAGSSNWSSGSVTLHMLEPSVSLSYASEIVRTGDTARIEWDSDVDTTTGISGPTVSVAPDIRADYDMDCRITGAVDDSFSLPSAGENFVTSDPLFNTFDTRLQCTVTTNGVRGNALEAIERIEVVPAPREN